MIGYMKPDKRSLSARHRKLYNKYYCGLCRTLRFEFGVTTAALLSYEIVNMLILLEAVGERCYKTMWMSCSISPLLWMEMCTFDNESFISAARLSIILARLEANDNLIDSGKLKDRLINRFMEYKSGKLPPEYLYEYDIIKESYDNYMALENAAKNSDESVTCEQLTEACGKIAGAAAMILSSDENDFISRTFTEIMCLWGEWTYIMDAVDDYKKDRRNGSFNPLFLSSCPENVNELLIQTENKANDLLNSLEILKNADFIDVLFRQQFPEMRKKLCSKEQSK